MSAAEQLDLFAPDRWPRKPYCTNELGSMHIRTLSHARRHRYIQPNAPCLIFRLIYDVDRPGAALAWDDANVAPPNWSAANPENDHAHLSYEISIPVATTNAARMAPVRLAAAIERAYLEVMAADEGYAGVLCKNPAHPYWRTEIWQTQPYELADLAEYVDLTRFRDRRKRPRTGIGRNVELFDALRRWAYPRVRHYWGPEGHQRWAAAVLERAEAFNQFAEPLPWSEVKATAKSVAKWTWTNITPAGWQQYVAATHQPAVQARRGQQKGARRRADLIPQALEMWAQGASQTAIAQALGVTRRTVFNWLQRAGEKKPNIR